jgi:superfamily II DNA/RNA helicase
LSFDSLSVISSSRHEIKVGNLHAFYKFIRENDTCESEPPQKKIKFSNQKLKNTRIDYTLNTPVACYKQIENLIPACIIEWLINYGYKQPGLILAHLWPPMLLEHDLLAIATNNEERILAFMIPVLAWILHKQNILQRSPYVVIFTSTIKSVKKIRSLIQIFDDLLSQCSDMRDFSTMIAVELPVQFLHGMTIEKKRAARNVSNVIFDGIDEMVTMGYINEVANILQTAKDDDLFDSNVCLNIFSAEFSVYEKLLGLAFLRNNPHFFDISALTGEISTSKSLNNFSHVQQFLEFKQMGNERRQSLYEVLNRIMVLDNSINFTTIVFVSEDDCQLPVVYNILIDDFPEIANNVFPKKSFNSDFEQHLFWKEFYTRSRPILLTNDSRNLNKGECGVQFPQTIIKSIFEFQLKM